MSLVKKINIHVALSIALTTSFASSAAAQFIGVETCEVEARLTCGLVDSIPCRNNPDSCTTQSPCIERQTEECLNNRTANFTHFVKYNTAGADYNFLEISNLSKSKNLIGAFRIFDIQGNLVGKPREFVIPARGRADFDIHSIVGRQVFGQVEISIYSEENTALTYMSFYNQRDKPSASGVFLDQTITVKGEQAP